MHLTNFTINYFRNPKFVIKSLKQPKAKKKKKKS